MPAVKIVLPVNFLEKVIMVFNYAGNVFQPLFTHYQNKKTKSTQLVKSKGKPAQMNMGVIIILFQTIHRPSTACFM